VSYNSKGLRELRLTSYGSSTLATLRQCRRYCRQARNKHTQNTNTVHAEWSKPKTHKLATAKKNTQKQTAKNQT